MKVFGKALSTLCVMFIFWVVISYAEIALENDHEYPKYSEYNCFVVTMRIMEDFE